jgi:hypothetical protein
MHVCILLSHTYFPGNLHAMNSVYVCICIHAFVYVDQSWQLFPSRVFHMYAFKIQPECLQACSRVPGCISLYMNVRMIVCMYVADLHRVREAAIQVFIDHFLDFCAFWESI